MEVITLGQTVLAPRSILEAGDKNTLLNTALIKQIGFKYF